MLSIGAPLAEVVLAMLDGESKLAVAVLLDYVAILVGDAREGVGGSRFSKVDCKIANMFTFDRAGRALPSYYLRDKIRE